MTVEYQTKPKPAKIAAVTSGKAKTAATKDPIEDTVDVMASMQNDVTAAKQTVAEYEKKRKFLADAIPADASDADPVSFKSETNEVLFSARSVTRTVANAKKLHEILGDKFYEIIEIRLKELDKYVAPAEQAAILVEARNGSRTHEVKALAAVTA